MPVPRRAVHLDQLRALYGAGIRERENTVALYDSYLANMHTGVTLQGLVDAVLARKDTARVLDVGCGDAGALRALAGPHVDAVGIDLVAPADAGPVRILTGDVLRAPLPADCDVVVSFRALHEIAALDAIIPSIARALAPGGRAVLSIRVAEFTGGRIEPLGAITPRDVEYLRTAIAGRRVAGVSIRGEEVAAHAAVRLPESGEDVEIPYVRGVNVQMERSLTPSR